MHQSFEATGMIMVERITPIITALFGEYLQQTETCMGGVFVKLWEESPPTWRSVHKALVRLSDQLDMPIPRKQQATIQGQLDWMSWFLLGEESKDLNAFLKKFSFEGYADVETLVFLSDVLDDGHGLFASRFEGRLAHGVPALLQSKRWETVRRTGASQFTEASSDLQNWLSLKCKHLSRLWASWVSTLLPQ